ncbi:CLUMA_CG004156, isoform A [Clunio marinus]|uniref:protein-serine/threonine phosphatase n=1 Tax=Clunio marinus TaxID=568069 RepID=A0A1J1HSU7_9DIPT|nr:CLUMA_CG004156, isoform A [Clunio marinus]
MTTEIENGRPVLTPEQIAEAEKFKEEANSYFKNKDYDKAIELYTKAIEIDPHNAVYYANRSLANLRQESFGYALNDALSSMKSDPGYLKAYYRRAAAHMSLGKFKLALSDFELVSKRRPNDADAKKKFVECSKIVKKIAFERAIAVDRPEKTLAEMYQSLESISIEDEYNGPKLKDDKTVTLDFMKALMEHYKDQKKLHKKYAYKINQKIFLGSTMADMFTQVYNFLPLCHLLNNRVLVMHGGLFSSDDVTIDDLRSVERNRQPPEEGIMCELLWSDPQPQPGRSPSKRGVGCQFGPNVTENFLKRNKLDYIIRSHEVKDMGYEVAHDGKCITVFSAPNYCDTMGNKGAYIILNGKDMKPQYEVYEAVPHPNVKPMMYANSLMNLIIQLQIIINDLKFEIFANVLGSHQFNPMEFNDLFLLGKYEVRKRILLNCSGYLKKSINMSSHYQLTPDVEFRYIVTWFKDFSEFEKADFMAILIQWLLKNSEINVNGLSDDTSMTSIEGKPLSIFLCRVKLFKEWTPKWPNRLRSKLIEKLNEIDSEFGLKLNQELEDALTVEEETTSVQNGIDAVHNGVAMLAVTED